MSELLRGSTPGTEAASEEKDTTQLGPSPIARRYGRGSLFTALRKSAPDGAEDVRSTIHDAATAAVEHKDAGRAVPAAVRAPVEAQLGVSLANARVHDDPLAQEATAAIGARAFAYSADVFLGPGESDGDLGLMAHELTHVAQQGASGQRLPQCQVQVGATDSPAEAHADAVAAAVTSGARPASLLVDDGPIVPGQMLKTQFLQELREQVSTAAQEELGPLESVIGCPYIDLYFSRYAGQPASAGEALLRRYAPATRSVRTAAEMIPVVVMRVREGVQVWRDTGRPPSDVGLAAGSEIAGPTGPGAGPPGTAAAKIAEFGPGESLDSTTAGRMGHALGADLSGVLVHTGPHAARAVAAVDASAVAVGQHVAFSPGAYQPGTPEGDALLAHELAHSIQQQDASPSALRQPLADAAPGHEADADQAAAGVIGRLWGAARATVSNASERIGPTLRSGLGLARCGDRSTPTPPATVTPSAPSTRPATDLHAGTGLPSTTDQATIQGHLNPTSASSSGGTPATWDAATSAAISGAERTRRRTALTTAINAAMRAHLRSAVGTASSPGPARRSASTRQIPMASWTGVGRAAKRAADARFAEWTSGAVLTPDLASARAAQHMDSSGPNQTLFNAWDRTDRARAGAAIDPRDLAGWMVDTDAGVQAAMTAHGFDRYRPVTADPSQEEQRFIDGIIATFVTSHRADLEMYDQYQFAITDRETGRISMFPGIDPGLSDVAPATGGPSPAERAARWNGFKTLVHEYFHTLEHPAFHEASRGRRVMSEGFCELFTKAVLDPDIAHAASDAALRTEVEGGTYPVDPAAIGRYDPGSYAAYLTHAEGVRDAAPGRDNAVRAAFFQGHVELIGLATDGGALTAAALAERDTVVVPFGILSLADLATATGLSEAELQTANPGISPPLPRRARLPGCREHTVVEASDAGGTRRVENRAQIASQNGVSEADLVRANNPIHVSDWNALTPGWKILIPRH